MNLYFSCSLTGGRDYEPIYVTIVDHLLGDGHEVPTAHLAYPDVMHLEKIVDPGEVFQRDTNWLRECDAIIAEVSTPSHGVGYEIAFALGLTKPVLCCFQEGVPVSKMLTGNDTPGIVVRAYRDPQHVLEIIDTFLHGLEADE